MRVDMRLSRRSTFMGGLLIALALAALLAAACGGDDGESAPPSASASASASTVASPSREATTTQTPATPATATSTAASPTPATKAAGEGPRVRWMVVDFFAPGVATVRFETDVETTALLSLIIRPGEPSNITPEEDKTFAMQHTISIPIVANLPAYQVVVTDRQGKKGTGNLERPIGNGEVVGNQFFGRGASRPRIAFDGGRKATVTWTNLVGGEPAAKGSVALFAKKSNCTNAQGCVSVFVQSFGGDTLGGDNIAATHSVPITFPADTTQDYQVLIIGLDRATANTQPLALFYQFDVPGSSVK